MCRIHPSFMRTIYFLISLESFHLLRPAKDSQITPTAHRISRARPRSSTARVDSRCRMFDELTPPARQFLIPSTNMVDYIVSQNRWVPPFTPVPLPVLLVRLQPEGSTCYRWTPKVPC